MRSRSSDPFARVLDDAAERVCAAVDVSGGSSPIVIIDGRSGSGKTSLARRVAEAWPLAGAPQRVALDSLYPGWQGLRAGAESALNSIVRPHSEGRAGVWRRWDWVRDAEAEQHIVVPQRGAIVEGCGALTRASAPLVHVRVWVDGPEATRKTRALERDGDGFRDYWDAWARQEDDHIRANTPDSLATIVIEVP